MNLKCMSFLKNAGSATLFGAFLLAGVKIHATDYNWTGMAGDGIWSSTANWDNGVPPLMADGVYLNPSNNSPFITINAGEVEWPGYAHATNGDHSSGTYGMIYGPEWGADLNVYGALHYDWYLAPVQSNPSNPSIINLYGDAVLTGEGIGLGDNWWYWGGPYVVMNLYDHATAGINWLYWGGSLNLYDQSVFSVTNGVTTDTSGLVSDATRMINLAGGTLVLPLSFSGNVSNWISRGILAAFGTTNQPSLFAISDSNPEYPGRTVVTAIPQPTPPNLMLPLYGDYYLHDPGTMIRDGTNYYLFGDGQGISGITSFDLRNWKATPPVFPNGPPSWTTNNIKGFGGYFWAPDNVFFGGQYHMYYACSIWGTINSAIGEVTTPSLNNPVWTDHGKVIESNYPSTTNTDLTAFNCIDPSILLDTNGTVWMSFGSYSDGILIMQLDPVTGMRIAPNSPIYRVSNNGPVFFSNTEEGSYLYQHDGYYYLFMNWGGCCAGVDSTYNIRVGRSPVVSGPYFDRSGINLTNGGGTKLLESTARFIGPGQAAIMNDQGTNWFTFHYYDGNNNGAATVGIMRLYWGADGWPVLTNDWSAFYPLNRDAHEQMGLYDGTLQGGALITNEPARGGVASLSGAGQYIQLADPVANCSTIAGWVKWNGGPAWQRIFDFGNSTSNYFFLTPESGGGNLRFAITTNGPSGEEQINASQALPSNVWCHVAVVLNGSSGVLYLNGIPLATNLNLLIRPWQILAKNNYLGRSEFPSDPYFEGELGSFRVFGRALSGAEILSLAYAPPELAHRYSFSGDARDSIGMAHGSLAGQAAITNSALVLNGAPGGFLNLPGGLISGCSSASIEFWATLGVNGDWARVFDFGNINGNSGQDFLFYTPHTPSNGQNLGMASSSTVNLSPPGVLDSQRIHVVCIVDPPGNICQVYTNGILEATYSGAVPPLSSVSTAWSFLGRSLFASDAWLNGSIDEFRVYDGHLTPAEIRANDQAGPDALALPVEASLSSAPSALTLSWPSWALGYFPQSAINLTAGAWSPLGQAANLSNNQWWLPLAPTNSCTFYRLQR